VNNIIQIILFQERENEYFVECRFASDNVWCFSSVTITKCNAAEII